ncbi:MerR family transcriptional regulator [Luteipulveratus sp. YIM 133132]|uniref:MerR family transcriptional regulator n=1 Tax=Luteipulveratus flavus TaxID=3031728 RepID=A0ABT6CB98_9MICO|nr:MULTISPECIES: MerR family transcriptional regulator [unclassified Luteipulveratus]MDE9364739.1 MerR family transcriptional regulator [Luteipulveratus sp. YIM 133132]MDF8266159.1 MerR family transcriptional regulator [Luteipulveratus sp. YIM 133296]
MGDGYSIGEVAAMTGVKSGTLRAWEDRYGLVMPIRSGSAYREYGAEDVETVRRMRVLVESGVPARRAAALSRAAHGQAAPTPVPAPRPTVTVEPVGGRIRLRGLDDTTAISRVGGVFDGPGLRRLLDEAFAFADVETVVDSWLMPSMTDVGAAWERGDLDVAAEHFISSAVMRKLAALFDATPAIGPKVVVGLPEDARHELPALAFALLLQRAGAQVLYVGADVPHDSWRRIVELWSPLAAVVAATNDDEIRVATRAARSLRDSGVELVYAGGSRAEQVEDAILVPEMLSVAAQAVASAVLYRFGSTSPRVRQLE